MRAPAPAVGAVCAAALLLAAGPGRAQGPAVGPPVEADRPVLVGAVGDQTVPAAAHLGGGSYLVVWRTALWEGEVRAARVTAAGLLEHPRGVVLPGLEGPDARVAVAAGGGGAIVVGAAAGQLQLVRLGPDGPVADAGPGAAAADAGAAAADAGAGEALSLAPGAPALLAAAPGESLGRPALSWHGAGFWVAWSQGAAGIFALRLDPQGQPVDSAPLRLSETPGHPALAWDGTRTLAAWSTVAGDRPLLRAARLEGDGRLLDAAPLELGPLPGARAGPAAVAWSDAGGGGGLFLAAAAGEGAGAAPSAVVAVRVAGDGRPLDPAPIVLASLAAPAEGGPTAIWNGSRFLVLWGESQGEGAGRPVGSRVVFPEGRLVAADGTVSVPAAPGLGAAGEQPVAVADGGRGVVFLARPPGGRGDLDVRGIRLAETGAADGADFLVSGGLNWQGNPALAAGGPADNRRLLMAWEDTRADRQNADIHVALLDAAGAPVAAASIPVATGSASQRAPAVAWDGRAFQVLWHERSRGLFAARVDLEGNVLDRTPLAVPGTAARMALSDPVVCGDDAGALLVWSARRAPDPPGAPVADARAVRIAPGGTVRDGQAVPLFTSHDVSTAPGLRLACAADAALLVWTGLWEMDRASFPDLQMALIQRRGEPAPATVTLLERTAADEGPAVASDGRGFLVAWRPRQGANRVDIFGTRVDASGAGLDRPARPLGSLNAGHRVSAYWDGAQYVLVGIQSIDIGNYQLRGRRVRGDLTAQDQEWFPIAKVSSRRGTGALPITVGLGAGAAVVAYDAFVDDDATGNQRLLTRQLTTPALPPGDGGPSADAAHVDAGADASVDMEPPRAQAGGGGCDCALGGTPTAPALCWVLAVVAALQRARRRRRTVGSDPSPSVANASAANASPGAPAAPGAS
jgi:hypothetical protein